MQFIIRGKTNRKFLLIIIIFAVIVGGGTLLWFNNQKTILVSDINTKHRVKDEIAGWETYRNKELGFSLRYPSDFKMTINTSNYELFGSTFNYQTKKESNKSITVFFNLNNKSAEVSLHDYLMRQLHWNDPIYKINSLTEGGFKYSDVKEGFDIWEVGPRRAICGWEGEIYLMNLEKGEIAIKAYFGLESEEECDNPTPKEEAQQYYDLFRELVMTFQFES